MDAYPLRLDNAYFTSGRFGIEPPAAPFRGCPVIVPPGYSRPVIRVADYLELLEAEHLPRRPRPLTPRSRVGDVYVTSRTRVRHVTWRPGGVVLTERRAQLTRP